MILQAHFFRQYARLFGGFAIALFLVMVFQAFLEILQIPKLRAFPLYYIILYMLKSTSKAFPIILNFSFFCTYALWKNRLKEEKHDHAALLAGWSYSHELLFMIGWALLVMSLNIFLLFFIHPVSSFFLKQDSLNNQPLYQLEYLPKNVPQLVQSRYVFMSEKASLIPHALEDIHLLGISNTTPINLYGNVLTIKQNGIINMEKGRITVQGSNPYYIDFDRLDGAVPQKQESNQAKSTFSWKQFQTSSSPSAKRELIWRYFLILQPLLLLFSYRTNITLKHKTYLTGTTLKVIAVFVSTTVLMMISLNNYIDQNIEIMLVSGLLMLMIPAAFRIKGF